MRERERERETANTNNPFLCIHFTYQLVYSKLMLTMIVKLIYHFYSLDLFIQLV